MKTVTVRDLRQRWPETEKALAVEHEILVTRDAKPVARLVRYVASAPARRRFATPDYPEWTLLFCLLQDLSLAEHVDPLALTMDRPESQALLALRDVYREMEEDPSLGVLLDRLQGHPCLEIVLRAHKYGEEIRFDAAEARSEFTEALGKLELARRKHELDELRGRLESKENRLAYSQKLMEYKRLQGALPSP